MKRTLVGGLLVALVLSSACGNDDQKECTPGAVCAGGQYCESFVESDGSTHAACFAPTMIAGTITDATTGSAVSGARVVAIDGDSHAAVGPVSITDAAGSYAVRVTAPRMSGAEKHYTLRVGATSYQEFPSGIRIALPITVAFTDPKSTATVAGPTNVAMSRLSQPPIGSIAGKVTGTTSAGVLVVATAGNVAYSTVTDATGDFMLFNVADGVYSVRAYFVGVNFTSIESLAVAGARVAGANLNATGSAAGVLTGTLSYVAGADTNITTAVVLRLRATREVPPGLQVSATNNVPYRLEGVPDGEYEVLASFPNDQLVKDPDPGQAGTATPVVTFNGSTVDVGSFKVTDPIDMIGPDANAQVSGTPTFTWAAYPQTDKYKLEIFDSQGNPVWMLDDIGRSTGLTYGGPTLTPGSYYQWRITSYAQSSNSASRPISQSEDLRGVWQQM